MTTLLVTNDFPPTIGGIQSYLRDFAAEYVARRGPDALVVFASTQDEQEAALYDASLPYIVIRWPHRLMLPTPAVAARMKELIDQHHVDTVWFGAAAPLAVMGGVARRSGATRIVATTHGHEVGWSMVPGTRQALRVIGNTADTLTYVSEYTRGRFARAFGSHPEYVALPSGVDTDFFRPATSTRKTATRGLYGYGHEPLVVVASRLVPRKGQDQLIRAWPAVNRAVPGARLAIVGEGPYKGALERLTREHGVSGFVQFHGRLERDQMRDLVAASDAMAMPARTRGGGLDVEGLGIVYLEAQACGVPVIAGRSGGAPETVADDTGLVVDGHDVDEVAEAVITLLRDPQRAQAMGQKAREFVSHQFSWGVLGERLTDILDPRAPRLE